MLGLTISVPMMEARIIEYSQALDSAGANSQATRDCLLKTFYVERSSLKELIQWFEPIGCKKIAPPHQSGPISCIPWTMAYKVRCDVIPKEQVDMDGLLVEVAMCQRNILQNCKIFSVVSPTQILLALIARERTELGFI